MDSPAGVVNQAGVETLVEAGGFDWTRASQAQLLAILPRAFQAAQSKQADRKRGQMGLFDVGARARGQRHYSAATVLPDAPRAARQARPREEGAGLLHVVPTRSRNPRARLRLYSNYQVVDLPGGPREGRGRGSAA